MARIRRTITINAPVEKVFDYWTDPTNLPEYWPSMVEVSDVHPLPKGGNSFRFVYKMAGMRFEGASEDTEFVPNERTVTKGKDGLESTVTATFQPVDDGTKMTFEVEYTVPIPLLGRLAEAVIVRLNENEANVVLANLKARMEA